MKKNLIRFAAVFLMAFPFVFAGQAFSQEPSVLEGHDTEQPIDIVADTLEVDQDARIATFEGEVEAVQGELKFTTKTLKVYYEEEKGKAEPTIARLDARGGIRLESPTESAEGNSAVYDVKNRIITLIGNVILRREDSEIAGERLEFDLVTGLTKFDGNLFNGPASNMGRVKGRFSLPKNTK